VKALAIRQPYAALVVAGIKDVENRSWRTRYRGPLLIHASLGRSRLTLAHVESIYGVSITPELEQLCTLLGGIVGVVNIVDCVTASASVWFDGPINTKNKPNYGFVFRDAERLPFHPLPGRLGLFMPEVDH
jgi:ASCH domain